MYGGNSITIVGNLAADPRVRVTAKGTEACSFTVFMNEQGRDDEEPRSHTVFVQVYGTLASNVAESLRKGMRVLVVGRVQTWTSEVFDKDGKAVNRTETSILAESIGPELRWATAEVTKNAPAGEGSAAKGKASSKEEPAF